jgi:hypothetical protein
MINKLETSTNEKVDALFKLEECSWKEYDRRRTYEWQINFSLWTGLAVLTGFALGQEKSIPLPACTWIIFLLFAIVYVIFQYGLFISNRRDQDKRIFYMDCVRDNLGISLPEKLGTRPKTSSKWLLLNWSHSSQIMITLLFLFLTWYVLSIKFLAL